MGAGAARLRAAGHRAEPPAARDDTFHDTFVTRCIPFSAGGDRIAWLGRKLGTRGACGAPGGEPRHAAGAVDGAESRGAADAAGHGAGGGDLRCAACTDRGRVPGARAGVAAAAAVADGASRGGVRERVAVRTLGYGRTIGDRYSRRRRDPAAGASRGAGGVAGAGDVCLCSDDHLGAHARDGGRVRGAGARAAVAAAGVRRRDTRDHRADISAGAGHWL